MPFFLFCSKIFHTLKVQRMKSVNKTKLRVVPIPSRTHLQNLFLTLQNSRVNCPTVCLPGSQQLLPKWDYCWPSPQGGAATFLCNLISLPRPYCKPLMACTLRRRSKRLKARICQVSVKYPGPGATRDFLEPSEHLWQVWGLILNMILPSTVFAESYSSDQTIRISFLIRINILLSMIVQ